MTEGGLPDLREPDLPRTARDRPNALRSGWTTGTCAAAAARAAAVLLSTGRAPEEIDVALPSGRRVGFPVAECAAVPDGGGQAREATAVVVKDAGDDPDVTHGARLTATVSWRAEPGLGFAAGPGVGTVTLPGLGLAVGEPAINPVPRAMIRTAVSEVIDLDRRGVTVTVAVPGGQAMARKTSNARLGILGGISILGTTGVVRPFSTAAWRASVVQAVGVLAAQPGPPALVLCTGGRTEAGARALRPDLAELSFVEVGDFTGAALRRAAELGLPEVVFVGMVGKLAKLAGGVLMTHWTRSKVPTGLLGELTAAAGGDPELAAAAGAGNTARHVYEMWEAAGLLGPAATLLCERVRDVLSAFLATAAAEATASADATGGPGGGPTPARTPTAPTVSVALVDFTGRRVIASAGPPGAPR